MMEIHLTEEDILSLCGEGGPTSRTGPSTSTALEAILTQEASRLGYHPCALDNGVVVRKDYEPFNSPLILLRKLESDELAVIYKETTWAGTTFYLAKYTPSE